MEPLRILAHSFDPTRVDPKGYWVSEKFDGVRACWTGDRLLTRTERSSTRRAPGWRRCRRASRSTAATLGRGSFQDTVSSCVAR